MFRMGCLYSLLRRKKNYSIEAGSMPSPLEEMRMTYKCVVVGDEKVGKTCLLIRYATNVFPEHSVPSRFDKYTAILNLGDETVNWELWDTDGQEDYDQIRPLNYTNADVFLVCFSIADPASLDNVKTKWVPEVRLHSPDIPIVLVGTKQDLQEDQGTLDSLKDNHLTPVTSAQASLVAEEVNAVKYVECSAVQKTGVQAAFDAALTVALEQQEFRCEGGEEEGGQENH